MQKTRATCGERMLGNEDVVCQEDPHDGGEHRAFVLGEGLYTWYVDRIGLERLRTALLR